MPIPNSDHVPDEFMPGIRSGTLPTGTGAPGSPSASGRAADAVTTTVTPPWGGSQDRYPASTGGTVEPGQSGDTPISPGPASGTGNTYTTTGAGDGTTMTNEHGRYPWQARAGRS